MGKEFKVPVNVTENLIEGAPRYIVCQPQVCCTVDEAFIDGDTYKLDVPLSVVVGQLVRFPIPATVNGLVGAREYTKESVCGVFVTVHEDMPMHGHRVPMAGQLFGDHVEAPAVIPPQTTSVVSFTSYCESGVARFKQLELKVDGDLTKLFLDDIRIGQNSQLVGAGRIPFAMALRPDSFHFPEVLAAGVKLTLTVSNLGAEPVALTGYLIFEEMDASAALPMKALTETN